MNPEDQLHAMADASRWDLDPFRPRYVASTTRVVADRPRRRPWFAVTIAVATVAIAAVVVVGAISFRTAGDKSPIAPATTGTSTPTPSGSATPPPTSLHAPEGTRPAQIFGGACSAVMSVAQFKGLGGASDARINQTSPSESLTSDELFATFEIGGIQCQWVSTGLVVSLTAVPTSGLPAASDQPCTGSSRACRFDITTSGLRFSGTVAATTLSESKHRALAIRDLFASQAPKGVADSAKPAASWSATSCATLTSAVRTVLLDVIPHLLGHMEGKAPLIQDLVRATYVDSNLGCEAQSKAHPGASTFIGAYGGGAWMRHYLTGLPGEVTSINVAGFDHAYTYTSQPSAPGAEQVWLFRGPNAIRLSYPTKSFDSYMKAMSTLADHLDATPAG